MKYIAMTIMTLILGTSLVAEMGQSHEREVNTQKNRPRCAVCGMFADMDTMFMTEVVLKGEKRAYFESPRHALMFYFEPEKYSNSVRKEDISHILVRDYITGRKAIADTMMFLIDSDVKGPMGKDIVPLSKENAKGFQKKHGGRLLKFGELNPEVVKPKGKGHMMK